MAGSDWCYCCLWLVAEVAVVGAVVTDDTLLVETVSAPLVMFVVLLLMSLLLLRQCGQSATGCSRLLHP